MQVGLLAGARQDELWGRCFPGMPPDTGQGGHSGLYIGPSPTSWLHSKRFSLSSLGLGMGDDSQNNVFTYIRGKEVIVFCCYFCPLV